MGQQKRVSSVVFPVVPLFWLPPKLPNAQKMQESVSSASFQALENDTCPLHCSKTCGTKQQHKRRKVSVSKIQSVPQQEEQAKTGKPNDMSPAKNKVCYILKPRVHKYT